MYRVFQQPDGRYAVFSTVVDDFLIYDASERDLREWWVRRRPDGGGSIRDLERRLENVGTRKSKVGPKTLEAAVERAPDPTPSV